MTNSQAALIETQRAIWQQKPVLRTIYSDFYARIIHAIGRGRTLEVGGGIGNLKERLQTATHPERVVSTDIQFGCWLDCVADAQALPFADGTFHNIVMVDLCHHLQFPVKFFREAERVLIPGGRIVMIESVVAPEKPDRVRCLRVVHGRARVKPDATRLRAARGWRA